MTTFGLSRVTNKLTARLGGDTRGREEALEPRAAETSMPAAMPGFPFASPEALQTAARLKVVLGEVGRVVAVTGIDASDGLTPLAAQLAVALAATDESPVLLMDGNVQEPRLHEIFRTPQQPGILDLLEQQSNLAAAAHSLEINNLFLLPAGKASVSFAALLSRPSASRVFDEIRRTYRYVIINAGVIRNHPDGTLLAALCDGVVAGVAAGARRRQEVLQFRQELNQLNIPLLGVVLTRPE